MGISSALTKMSPFFNSRYKLPVHITELCLVIAVVVLSVVRLAMGSPQRAHMMGIAIGIKSLLFILYQLLTEHTRRFSKWASKKANFILNCIDCPFWGAMVFLLFQSNITRVCTGTSCVVSWIMAVVSIALLITSHWLAFESYFEYKTPSKNTTPDNSDGSSYEVMRIDMESATGSNKHLGR